MLLIQSGGHPIIVLDPGALSAPRGGGSQWMSVTQHILSSGDVTRVKLPITSNGRFLSAILIGQKEQGSMDEQKVENELWD
ncbi:hypothetical protein GJ744_006310 [Endocarpon pusillum]|uniref:Uncharacterized protein n=1 Tax=Endocarpon pusillum TaxID=364733 RepID=A0A8H7DWS5_9EURO|nr:hypothetical protein GJ744_006310 [Endocarpon pusillum]